jgi:hypothetical protein
MIEEEESEKADDDNDETSDINSGDDVHFEAVVLGSMEFELPLEPSTDQPEPLILLQITDPEVYNNVSLILRKIEFALLERFGQSFSIAGGYVEPGSIRFKDGKFVVTTKTLAMILVGYGLLVNYHDLRESVVALSGDISYVVQTVSKDAGAMNIIFVPSDSDRVLNAVLPNIPQTVRQAKRRR